MKIKRFVAKDIRLAIRMVKDELGADAVIMSNKSVIEGVEIVAARDFDEQAIQSKLNSQESSSAHSHKNNKKIELTDFETENNKVHLIKSSRKIGTDGTIPKRALNRNIDQYVGYAEKINLTSENNRSMVKKYKQQQTKPAKQFSNQVTDTMKQPLAVADNFMQEIRNEIKELKLSLNTKLADVSWNQGVQNSPVRSYLLHRLSGMGFSKKLAMKIVNRLDSHKDSELAFEKAKEMLVKVLPVVDDNLLEHGGIFALVGPTGVGKTTTIAKLAAKFILKHGPRQVALITTDNYRIGAHEQLTTYGRLLDVPVRVAANADELRSHINGFNDKRLILIDTAGMSQRDMRLSEQIHTLQQEDLPIKTYLVMSAATQYKAVNEIINAFKVFEPESSILTKLDEAATQGSILSAIIEQQLPVSFMTNGQQVPEDICFPDAYTMIEQCATELAEENDYTNELGYDDWMAEGYA
ncbi:MAG: flagellar biosynthesis protein FlhF [Methylococcaceae bacterium]|nr:flagellar biosynthesis protein FlhF [Methylococcaceae bacterium]